MNPDFSKNTVDIIAKRAGFICSNPDCRTKTVGPNSQPDKSTTIGEAAHIRGARPSAKRFKAEMTDSARSEVTNAIWLCRNCHKLIDTDEEKFSTEDLFKWREIHEEYILSELGSKSAQIKNEQLQFILDQFESYPFIIRRIIVDKPDGWEYRLTAELMRYLNAPHLRKLKDLRNNLYLKPQNHIEEEDAFNWIGLRLTEASNLIEPLVNLVDELNKTWGEPGVAGDVNEIHHVCKLIADYLEQIVQYEELINFTNVPEEYEKLRSLLKNNVGEQTLKIERIPERLDHILTLISNESDTDHKKPQIIEETIVLELPEHWEEEFHAELQLVGNQEIRKAEGLLGKKDSNGCTTIVIVIVIIIFLMMLF
ncbi:MAG: hypothetical protein R8N23_08545 [Reichenbachiella sp.]|uniref:hypothetical protein n=1 Tax=Reichenbachiella sp. TaxID=2184521 RepID=UPI00296710FF|nr:hypothetical protein [Reichenbachiella sp.]MDW3209901.1 hypothetical protein [Reichenbachiella sp.]